MYMANTDCIRNKVWILLARVELERELSAIIDPRSQLSYFCVLEDEGVEFFTREVD